MDSMEIIRELVEGIESAIEAGDWAVDGACDPDVILERAKQHLRDGGYVADGLTGKEWFYAA